MRHNTDEENRSFWPSWMALRRVIRNGATRRRVLKLLFRSVVYCLTIYFKYLCLKTQNYLFYFYKLFTLHNYDACDNTTNRSSQWRGAWFLDAKTKTKHNTNNNCFLEQRRKHHQNTTHNKIMQTRMREIRQLYGRFSFDKTRRNARLNAARNVVYQTHTHSERNQYNTATRRRRDDLLMWRFPLN